jgi:hypothetical protein
LHDRSSRPHRLRQPTPQAVIEEIRPRAPDVILASGAVSLAALFASDPHGADRVRECRRPGRGAMLRVTLFQ